MKTILASANCRRAAVSAVTLALLGLVSVTGTCAQDASQANEHAHQNSTGSNSEDRSLAVQLRELQAKVIQLEAALKQDHQATADSSHIDQTTNPPQEHSAEGMMMGMDMMANMGRMGMGMGKSGMQSAQGMSGMGGMGMMKNGMGMMGRNPAAGATLTMAMPSSLPGFPGASHIYHIGEVGFFLDHPQHIALSLEQQARLNQIKEQALLGQATQDRWIDAGEQELWVLTSADSPDATKVEAKIREIEKLRADKRIAFIQAIGEAARVLTNEQRQSLVGLLPLQHTTSGNSQN